MKSPGKRVAVAVALCAVASLWLADEYPAFRFHGDGRFSGGPVFGYTVTMRPIPFAQAGEYVFHFRGLPEQEMTLELYAEGESEGDRDELTHLGTTLGAALVDQNGRILCQASTTAQGNSGHNWVLTSGSDEAAFWHRNCAGMLLKPPLAYTLTLRISNVDPKTPRINLVPVLHSDQLDLLP